MKGNAIAQTDPLAPGLRIGRYELIRRLAVGGMAEIYLARATGIEGFEKLVVLKRILPQFAHSAGFISMFLDEARLTATLQHPNIAQVYDIGEFGGSYFFTMEFVRGADVRSMLKTALICGEPIPLEHVLTIILGVTAGLHAAHEKRGLDGTPLEVVHRDVSPSNVLVSYDGAVKLVDFGIAKASQHRNRTQAGTLKGKAAYMSPEQCLGRPLDRRSDVFAIGILLYELACCRRLFVGDSEFEIMSKIVNQNVTPPSEDDPSFPAGLEPILLRALNREPEKRYATAQAMQLELEEFVRDEKLAVSTVKLGEFMRKMFGERMREQEQIIAQQLRTGELALADEAAAERLAWSDDDDGALEIEADEAGETSNRAVAAVDTAMFAVEELAIPRAAGRRRSGATAPRESGRRRRSWPWMLVGATAAACALWFASGRGELRAGQREARVTADVTVEAAEPGPAPASAGSSSAHARAEPSSEGDGAAGAPTLEGRAEPDEAEALPAPQPVADTEAHARPNERARTRRRPHSARGKRARTTVEPERGPGRAAAEAWSLDSPLPPPRSN